MCKMKKCSCLNFVIIFLGNFNDRIGVINYNGFSNDELSNKRSFYYCSFFSILHRRLNSLSFMEKINKSYIFINIIYVRYRYRASVTHNFRIVREIAPKIIYVVKYFTPSIRTSCLIREWSSVMSCCMIVWLTAWMCVQQRRCLTLNS